VFDIVDRVLRDQIGVFTSEAKFAEDWNLEELFIILRGFYPISFGPDDLGDLEDLDADDLVERVLEDARAFYEAKEVAVGADNLRDLERWVLLRTLDARWRDHLYEMDYLREGIGLRALAQKDPLVEYKSEGFDLFGAMLDAIQVDFVRYIFHLEIVRQEPSQQAGHPRQAQLVYTAADDALAGGGFAGVRGAGAGGGSRVMADTSAQAYESAQQSTQTVTAPRRVDDKVGRNDPCPCGSGKKYKKCHGA
jgi:preprotein translocase subunit SecA